MEKNKIKVVWLCNFVSQEMNRHFNTNEKELSPWVIGLINLFQNNLDVEVHVVAPNVYTNKTVSLHKNGIHFHLFQYRSRIIPRNVFNRFRLDFRTHFFAIKLRVDKIIARIKPDLVHLIGAENPYYSAAVLPLFKTYPVLISIQGFVRHASNKGYVHDMRVKIEEKIIKKAKFIGVQAEFMKDVIKEINPQAEIIKHDYPNTFPKLIKNQNIREEYDFVFFARVIRDKGIEDLLKAVSEIKTRKSDVSLLVIGKIQKPYEMFLKDLINELKIVENVSFTGFLPTQQDVYHEAIKARICVLPTYHDIIPGTLVESIMMKLACIAYNVGGVPDLNLRNECVILVEKKNISQLADKMWYLLENSQKRYELAETAYETIKEQFSNDKIPGELISIYRRLSGK